MVNISVIFGRYIDGLCPISLDAYTKSPVCPICRDVGERHEKENSFLIKDAMPGDNAPPMHANCRCGIAAYAEEKEVEKRLDFLDKGGTTKEWNRLKYKQNKSSGGVFGSWNDSNDPLGKKRVLHGFLWDEKNRIDKEHVMP